MTGHEFACSRCGRTLQETPAAEQLLPWWDSARVRAQGWVGAHPGEAIGLECLTHEEADFIRPRPARRAAASGRFRRGTREVAVPDQFGPHGNHQC
jgi:hypothetical protein